MSRAIGRSSHRRARIRCARRRSCWCRTASTNFAHDFSARATGSPSSRIWSILSGHARRGRVVRRYGAHLSAVAAGDGETRVSGAWMPSISFADVSMHLDMLALALEAQ